MYCEASNVHVCQKRVKSIMTKQETCMGSESWQNTYTMMKMGEVMHNVIINSVLCHWSARGVQIQLLNCAYGMLQTNQRTHVCTSNTKQFQICSQPKSATNSLRHLQVDIAQCAGVGKSETTHNYPDISY